MNVCFEVKEMGMSKRGKSSPPEQKSEDEG